MADPAITELTIQKHYSATNTKSLFGDLHVPLSLGAGSEFTVTYPAAAVDVQITVFKGAASLALLPAAATGGVSDSGTTFANRQVDATATGGVLTCSIQALAGPVAEDWRVEVTGTAPHDYQIDTPDCTVDRVMCDPIAKFTVSSTPAGASPNEVPEKSDVLLTAANAFGPGPTRTVFGLPIPVPRYRFRHTSGDIAITSLPSCGTSSTFPFKAPGVYGDKTADVTLDVWFDATCAAGPGPLNNTTAPTTITVKPRAQRLVLVLDRSGSMNNDGRWTAAETTARVLVNIFAALRDGVHVDDRVGILVFEDPGFPFHAPPVNALVAPVLPMSELSTADGGICALNLGTPGSNTPIGDGLGQAEKLLGTDPEIRRTIVLLTDGYENTGTLRVDPNTPSPGFAPPTWVQPLNIPIYALGLGPTVQEDVLDHIALPFDPAKPPLDKAHYRKVTDVGKLDQAIADMVAASQEAQQTPALAIDPAVPERILQVAKGSHRLVIAIEWANPADTIKVEWRDPADVIGFQEQALPVRQCPRHGFVGIDMTKIVTAGPDGLLPATEWRISHMSGGVAVPIPDDDLLAYEDLYARADIGFDRDRYFTGDKMRITARLRAGAAPIAKGRVTVELARPGESLGTFLAENAKDYKPPKRPPDVADIPAPKQHMLLTLLRQQKREDLEILTPTGFFADGTDDLWDDGAHNDGEAGNGDFANVFVETDKEGTYTFRFFVEGCLDDGSSLRRVLTVSRWVGPGTDPSRSRVEVVRTEPSRGGLSAVISITPQDRFGNLLGPFRVSQLAFHVTDAKPVGPIEDHLNGTYSQTIVYDSAASPTVSVAVDGKEIEVVKVTTGST
jgi:hypothetical protein